jgi:hypothetical protein
MDVTLDRLFRATKNFEFGGQKLTARALSGPEREERSMQSTNATRQLEKLLQNEDSSEYQFHLRLYENLDEDGLKQFLTIVKEGDLYRDASKEHKPIYQPEPDNVTDDERRALLNSREEAEKARKDKIDEIVKTELEKFKSTLEKLPKEELLSRSRKLAIGRVLNEKANAYYTFYTIYKGVLQDGKPYFNSFEDASSIGREAALELYLKVDEVDNISFLGSNGSSLTDTPATSP